MSDPKSAGPLDQPFVPGAPTPDAPMTLSDTDLKAIKNEVISLLTHSADVQAWLDSRIAHALDAAQVLTPARFRGDDAVYRRLSDVVYEQLGKYLDPKPGK